MSKVNEQDLRKVATFDKGEFTMEKKLKYPCIVNKSNIVPEKYIGIMFNGDKGVYKKKVVKALKKEGISKDIIKAVKAVKFDLEISKILIDVDQFDVLVEVFNNTDARTAVMDYIDNLYSNTLDETKNEFAQIVADLCKTTKGLGKKIEISEAISNVDKVIDERTATACKKLIDVREEISKNVIVKYYEALERKKKRLNEEIQRIEEENKKLDEIIKKIS